MQIVSYKDKDFVRQLERLYRRPSYPQAIEAPVARILDEVRRHGDAAIKKYAWKLDGVKLAAPEFRLTPAELAQAADQLEPDRKKAIRVALKNVRDFARRRRPRSWRYSPRPGVTLGEKFEPLDRVAVYVPGGAAPLVSTVIHTAGLAAAAGVKEIVAFTPPGKQGKVHPAILYALKATGVTEAYRLGGVYAVGAAAFGTATIRPVEKIVGPGNAYVTAAKKLVYGRVALDLVAGPSEIMIIADAGANPEFIAADMLSQAEHGSGLEQAVLVTTAPELLKTVPAALERQVKKLMRQTALRPVLARGVFLVEVANLEQATEVAGRYAPEHLELMCRHAERVANRVKAAGAIFIGPWTPEPVGDFVAGPSHVLPTAGTAHYFNGLSVEAFFRRTSIIRYRKSALATELDAIAQFAAMEGLDAHGHSAAIRRTAFRRR